jgi:hypothetical protein
MYMKHVSEVIFGLILFAFVTLIYKSKILPSKIINPKDSTQSCYPSEESDMGRGLDLPNAFPGNKKGSSDYKVI